MTNALPTVINAGDNDEYFISWYNWTKSEEMQTNIRDTDRQAADGCVLRQYSLITGKCAQIKQGSEQTHSLGT